MVNSATLRRAVKIAPVAAMQTQYSVFTRDIEGPAGTNLLAACRDLGVAVVVAAPLGRGIITADFTQNATAKEDDDNDMRSKRMPQFVAENREHNVQVVSRFKALADRKGCTVAQLALAWLLKQGDDIFPIPGTKKVKYLEQNWGALEVQLGEADLKEIEAFGQENELAGGTVPEQYKGHLFRDTKEVN